MRFPNAYSGVKKLFTAEILELIAAVLLVIMLIAVGAGSTGEISADASTAAVGVAGGLAIIAAILAIVAVVLNLVGLNQASHDEQKSFRTAFFFALIELVASALSNFLGDKTDIFDLVVKICTIGVFVYTVGGISNLAKQYGNNKMVSLGNKILILEVILVALTAILEHLPKGNAANTAAAISSILTIVVYVIYLVYLSKAKKMLAN